MHRVPEPEPLLVRLTPALVEERVVRVHLLPAFGARRGPISYGLGNDPVGVEAATTKLYGRPREKLGVLSEVAGDEQLVVAEQLLGGTSQRDLAVREHVGAVGDRRARAGCAARRAARRSRSPPRTLARPAGGPRRSPARARGSARRAAAAWAGGRAPARPRASAARRRRAARRAGCELRERREVPVGDVGVEALARGSRGGSARRP